MHAVKLFIVGWMSEWFLGNWAFTGRPKCKLLPLRMPVAIGILALALLVGQHGTPGKIFMVFMCLASCGWLFMMNMPCLSPTSSSLWGMLLFLLTLLFGLSFATIALIVAITEKAVGPIVPEFASLLLVFTTAFLVCDLFSSLTEFMSLRRLSSISLYCKVCGWRKRETTRYSGRSIEYLGGGRGLATSHYSHTLQCPWHGLDE